MRTKAVIFDFDGVIAESVDVKTQAFAALYKDYGNEVVQAVIGHHLRNGGMPRYKKFQYYHCEILGKQLAPEEEEELAQQFAELVCEGVINAPLVPGAREFLEEHRSICDMHVASGTPHDEMQRIVESRGLSEFFLSVHGSPPLKTEIIASIFSAYGYSPQSVVMVGDALSDYESAIESGVHFVGRVRAGNSNLFPKDVLTIPDLNTLEDVIERL